MTDHEPFLQAIRQAPGDDTPRLIYADWLEEHGQADRAEFIRLQCRIARLPDLSLEMPRLMERVEDLLRSHWEEWVGPLRELVGPWRDRYGERWLGEAYHREGLWRFQRGFVNRISLATDCFLRHARQVRCLTPQLDCLNLWGAGQRGAELAQIPELQGVITLVFVDYYQAPVTADDAAALVKSPYLHGLSALFLARNSLGDAGVEALVQAPWLVSVTDLDLTDNGLSDRGARALVRSPYLTQLLRLHLERNNFSHEGIAALRDAPNFRNTGLRYDSLPPRGWLL